MNQDKLYHMYTSPWTEVVMHEHMYTSPWTEVVMYEPGQTLHCHHEGVQWVNIHHMYTSPWTEVVMW